MCNFFKSWVNLFDDTLILNELELKDNKLKQELKDLKVQEELMTKRKR